MWCYLCLYFYEADASAAVYTSLLILYTTIVWEYLYIFFLCFSVCHGASYTANNEKRKTNNEHMLLHLETICVNWETQTSKTERHWQCDAYWINQHQYSYSFTANVPYLKRTRLTFSDEIYSSWCVAKCAIEFFGNINLCTAFGIVCFQILCYGLARWHYEQQYSNCNIIAWSIQYESIPSMK